VIKFNLDYKDSKNFACDSTSFRDERRSKPVKAFFLVGMNMEEADRLINFQFAR